MKNIYMACIISFGTISSYAVEFMLTDVASRLYYGPYRCQSGVAILDGSYTVQNTSNRQFFIKGFNRGIGHTYGPFYLTNNAVAKIGQMSLTVVTGPNIEIYKEKAKQAWQAEEMRRKEVEQQPVRNRQSISTYISNRYSDVTTIPDESLDRAWYTYGIDRGVIYAAMRGYCRELLDEKPLMYGKESDAFWTAHQSNSDWIFIETMQLVDKGYQLAIPGYAHTDQSHRITIEKYDSLIRGMVDALDERKPNLRTYGLSPPARISTFAGKRCRK